MAAFLLSTLTFWRVNSYRFDETGTIYTRMPPVNWAHLIFQNYQKLEYYRPFLSNVLHKNVVTEQRSKKPNRGGHIGVNCTALIKTEAIDSPKSQSWKKKRCHYFWDNWEIITMFVFLRMLANVCSSPSWFISFCWLKGK